MIELAAVRNDEGDTLCALLGEVDSESCEDGARAGAATFFGEVDGTPFGKGGAGTGGWMGVEMGRGADELGCGEGGGDG